MHQRHEWPAPLNAERLHSILSGHPAFSNRVVSIADATITIKRDLHAGKLLILNRAAGITATLPAATGTGDEYDFIVGTAVTSNNDIVKVANATDVMVGTLESTTATGATTNGFCEAAAGTDDTITMNGSTTGGLAGSRVKCIDIASGVWYVEGFLTGSGTLATSLSATVA